MKGVPVRLALGSRDIENGTVEVARRDTLTKETIEMELLETYIADLLDDIQTNLYKKAIDFRNENTYTCDTWDEFQDILENKGGFVYAHWDGTAETEAAIKDKLKVTIRCIPFNNKQEDGVCILSGKPSKQRVLFAKAY
jgi:prolyl-tRNA synthetase